MQKTWFNYSENDSESWNPEVLIKNLIFPREWYESMAGTRERSKELAATIFN